MKRSTVRIAVLAAALVALVPATAVAQGFGPGPGHRPGGHGDPGGPGAPGGHGRHGGLRFMRMLHDVDLSDAQRTQVHALADEARTAIGPLLDRLHESRKSFEAGLDPATFDEAALRAQLKKDAVIHEEIAVIEGRTASKVFALLTETQKAEVKARRERRFDDRD